MGEYISAAFDLVRDPAGRVFSARWRVFSGADDVEIRQNHGDQTGSGDYPPGSGNFWSPMGPTPALTPSPRGGNGQIVFIKKHEKASFYQYILVLVRYLVYLVLSCLLPHCA